MRTNKIENLTAVRGFFKTAIFFYKLNFHPDTRAEDYVNTFTGKPSLTGRYVNDFNEILDNCFSFCEKNKLDIYEIANEVMKDFRIWNIMLKAIEDIHSIEGEDREPYDGDETQRLANLFLLELDNNNGNLSMEEYEDALYETDDFVVRPREQTLIYIESEHQAGLEIESVKAITIRDTDEAYEELTEKLDKEIEQGYRYELLTKDEAEKLMQNLKKATENIVN